MNIAIADALLIEAVIFLSVSAAASSVFDFVRRAGETRAAFGSPIFLQLGPVQTGGAPLLN